MTSPRWLVAASLLLACVAARPAQKVVTHHARIAGFQFIPAELHVARGDTVVWTNGDIVQHTVTSDTPEFDTGAISPDSASRVVFGAPGRFAYHCEFHPTMKAVVVVK